MNGLTVFNGYTPVNLEIMRLDRVPGFDLYIFGAKGPVLYREKQIKFTYKNLKTLLENNIKYLYFKDEEADKYYEYIEENLLSIIEDKKISGERKANLIYNTSAHLAQQMIQEPDSGRIVVKASKVMAPL